eukprot:gene6388-7042_t
MDLQSSHGTKINGKQLETARYYELRPGDLIEFATSTRQYVLLHDKAAYQIDRASLPSSPTDHPVTPTEHSSHQSITRHQGWAGYLFGYLMRAQLDSDLLGSSGHPSSSSGGGGDSSHHGAGRSASGTALQSGEQKASEVRASREVS